MLARVHNGHCFLVVAWRRATNPLPRALQFTARGSTIVVQILNGAGPRVQCLHGAGAYCCLVRFHGAEDCPPNDQVSQLQTQSV